MEIKVEKLPKATVKLTIKVPAEKVDETYNKVLDKVVREAEIEGFRKGKAPKELVEKRSDLSKLNGETVNELLKEHYVTAIKEHLLYPVGNPKVTIKSFDRGKDFEFEATVAVRPEVQLGDYRKKIGEKTGKISVDDILEAISDSTDCEVSDLLVEEEVTRMLSRLLSQTETLGLSIEEYLSAQNKTTEQLKKEYEEKALKNLKTEFALAKAIEAEQVKVEESEIEEAIKAVGDEKLRADLQSGANRWYIISVIGKNKLIQKLLEEFEKEEKHETS